MGDRGRWEIGVVGKIILRADTSQKEDAVSTQGIASLSKALRDV
jgi:hypothetical protein